MLCLLVFSTSISQAGDKDHVGEGRGSTFSSEAGTAAWTSEGLSSYLVCAVESTADNAPQGAVDLGMVAIETSTGDILYNQFRSVPCHYEEKRHQPGRSGS